MRPSLIASVKSAALNIPLREPFGISGGVQTRAQNILVSVRLKDGTYGYGEGAPMPAYDGQTQKGCLAALKEARPGLLGLDIDNRESWLKKTRQLRSKGPACAALETACFDAWARRRRVPLYRLFGGAQNEIATDVTIPIVDETRAEAAARRLWGNGIRTLKIKVGRDDDVARVQAVRRGAPRAGLILDANAGLSAQKAVAFIRELKKLGIVPSLFEQPVGKNDLDGLAEVERKTRVPVAADESARTPKDVLEIAKRKACSIVNLKIMKTGLASAWESARVARAGGLGLMIGGLVESRLAMTASAHLACGFGGFKFCDLDMPLFLADDPMKGLRMKRGAYSLSSVKSGIGVAPK